MKKKVARWLAGLLCFLMIFQGAALTALADDPPAEASETVLSAEEPDDGLYWINPIYEDILPDDYLEEMQREEEPPDGEESQPEVQLYAIPADVSAYVSEAEAVAALKAAMVNRQNAVEIKVATESSKGVQQIILDIFQKCFAETDSTASTEGDYLYYHCYGMQVMDSRYSNYSYTYDTDSGQIYLRCTYYIYYTSTEQDEQDVADKLQELYAGELHFEGEDQYTKAEKIYGYITDHTVYDYEALTLGMEGKPHAWSAYGGLISETCVCQGYAVLLHRMLKDNGFSTRVIAGYGVAANGTKEGHAWNIVRIGGLYYNVDSTWDSTRIKGRKGTRNWFLQSQEDFIQHERWQQYDSSSFHAAYVMSPKSYKDATIFENATYSISYVLDGGTNHSSNPASYEYVQATFTLKPPTKMGYLFAGWYTDPEMTEQITSVRSGSTGNLTLYAKWTAIQYYIYFNGNSATSGSMPSMTCSYDQGYALSANTFSRTGYRFVNWNTRRDGKGTAYADQASVQNLASVNDSSLTLYAQWSVEKYNISYQLNGGTNHAGNPTVYDVTAAVTLRDPTKAGYVFGGWYSNPSFATKVTAIPAGSTGDRILYAKWVEPSTTISLAIPSGYSDTVWLDGVQYAYVSKSGSTVTVKAADGKAKSAVVYKYDKSGVPVGMYVWTLNYANYAYQATAQPQLENLLTYHGCSIRITGKAGIRFKTGVSADMRKTLSGAGVNGYRLKEYGTLVMNNANRSKYPMIRGGEKVSCGVAYGYDASGTWKDAIYETVGGRYRFTSVLVGLPANQYKVDYAFRGYMVLEKNGTETVVYGPIVARNIYALAQQVLNMGTYKAGSSADTFLRQLIKNAK